MTEKPWYLRPYEEGEPEPKSCLNCARDCKDKEPFYPCPYWATLEDMWIGGDDDAIRPQNNHHNR